MLLPSATLLYRVKIYSKKYSRARRIFSVFSKMRFSGGVCVPYRLYKRERVQIVMYAKSGERPLRFRGVMIETSCTQVKVSTSESK